MFQRIGKIKAKFVQMYRSTEIPRLNMPNHFSAGRYSSQTCSCVNKKTFILKCRLYFTWVSQLKGTHRDVLFQDTSNRVKPFMSFVTARL